MMIKKLFIFYLIGPTLFLLLIFSIFGMIATKYWNDFVRDGNNLTILPNFAKPIGEYGEMVGISVLGIFLVIGVIIGMLITVLIFRGFFGSKPKMTDD